MHIRNIQNEDLEVLSQIFSESFTSADPEKPWDVSHSKKYLEYWLMKQQCVFLGYLKITKKLLAQWLCIKPWRTNIRCTDGFICIAVNQQKKGYGALLFKKVLEEAVQKYEVESFEAITFAGEEFPLTWYKKIGIMPDEHAVVIKGLCKNILNNL